MRNLSGNFTSSPAALPDSQDQVWALGAHEAPEVVLTVASICEVLSGGAFGCIGQWLCGVGLAERKKSLFPNLEPKRGLKQEAHFSVPAG